MIKKSYFLVVGIPAGRFIGTDQRSQQQIGRVRAASVCSTNNEETASGEDTQPQDFTGAHRSLPFGTLVHTSNQENGRSVVVRITDRGRKNN
jgi:rare lipoprotein A (peptidoglycan hydrolase)